MQPFTTLTGRVVTLPADNIDTDQIIPARFLTTTTKAGLGRSLFAGWRYAADGSPQPDFVLNQPAARGASILLAGDNFGCGSSREHAPWALMDYGFRAVVSTSFADIFRNNALKNGLLPIVVDAQSHRRLLDLAGAGDLSCQVDLASQTLALPDGHTVQFPIDAFNKTCLMEGVDELGYLLKLAPAIAAYEQARKPRVNTGVANAPAGPC
ncbi:MAG TPA: 3-isopropylmalate dehydratase small subunit [Anaerolineae bacterium]